MHDIYLEKFEALNPDWRLSPLTRMKRQSERLREASAAGDTRGVIAYVDRTLVVAQAMRELRGRYSLAVPCPEAIDAIASLGEIVQIGAGSGYWARLIADRGCKVHAFDNRPPTRRKSKRRSNFYFFREQFHPVRRGTPLRLRKFAHCALFVCWPPNNDPFAYDCLRYYEGDRVAFIGEGKGMATGDDAFYDRLNLEFENECFVSIPQWDGIHDSLSIWRRVRRARNREVPRMARVTDRDRRHQFEEWQRNSKAFMEEFNLGIA